MTLNSVHRTIVIFSTYTFFCFIFLSKNIYKNSFYLLSFLGLFYILFSTSEVYKQKFSSSFKYIVLIIVVLFLVFLTVSYLSLDTRSLLTSGSWLILLLIPVSILMILEDVETRLFYLGFISVFIFSYLSFLLTGMSIDSYEVLQSKYSKLLLVVIFVPLFRSVFNNADSVFSLFCVSTIVSGLVGIADYYFYEISETWIFDAFIYKNLVSGNTNPIHYATFVACTTSICVAALLEKNKLFPNIVYVIAIILGLVVIVLSESRGVMLSIPFFFAAILFFAPFLKVKQKLFILGLGLILACLLYQIPTIKNDFSKGISELNTYSKSTELNMKTNHTSISVRIGLWKAAWEMFKTSPVFWGGARPLYEK